MEKTSSICGKNTKQQQTMTNNNNNNNGRSLKDLLGYKYKSSQSTWEFGNKNTDATNYKKGELTGRNAAAAFSWPPRSYTCSFCKREFRSAQALGGHMNVHRRDRARLHQSPVRDINNIGQYPLLNLDPNPSSSGLTLLSPSQQTSSASHYPKCPHLANLVAPKIKNVRPLAVDFMKVRSGKGLFGVENKAGSCSDAVKKAEFVRLDLEIGLISQSKYDHEDLDLELRLGYTSN